MWVLSMTYKVLPVNHPIDGIHGRSQEDPAVFSGESRLEPPHKTVLRGHVVTTP